VTKRENSKQLNPLLALAVTDPWLSGAMVVLLSLGLVMVASASLNIAEQQFGDPFHYVSRQALFVVMGLIFAVMAFRFPLRLWEKLANPLLALGMILLVMVLIPGIGKEVNGSHRWLSLYYFNIQASEIVKFCLILYFAAFLVRNKDKVCSSLVRFSLALLPLLVTAVLLLLEPDLGATVVMVGAVLGLFFLAGVRLWHFTLLLGGAIGLLAVMVVISPYRFERLISFLSACEPEFYYNQGYQLCQALIAFSRGEWLGVGLGSGVQKMFYLPEAHTDFVMAILAEELGAVGSLLVIILIALVVIRGLKIAQCAEAANQLFSAYLAYGISLWLGIQALVNIGVNMGLLPTKGLTLPLMSYGGSSVVVTCVAIALLLRVKYETPTDSQPFKKGRGKWAEA